VPMRKSEARKTVAAYVADRLSRECATRGRGAELARLTGFSRGHVSAVLSGASGVGEDFADAIARAWGMTNEELETTAAEWAAGENLPPPPATSPVRKLRDRPEWATAVQAAKIVFGSVPDAYFEQAGSVNDDVTQTIDALFVGQLAQILHDLSRREEPPVPSSSVKVSSSAPPEKKSSKRGH
jgi:transcriptional regulator with XRE-family HTH domain